MRKVKLRKIDSIKCNLCGKELDYADSHCGMHYKNTLGYGGEYDGFTIDLRLCSRCMCTLIDKCAKSPLVDDVEEM